MPPLCRLILLIAITASFGTSVCQTSSTSLRGTVTDPNGAVLPDADLVLVDGQTGISRSVKTDNAGVYQFLHLPPATYSITVVAKGFATIKQDNVSLLVDTPATIDFTVKVQGETQMVEVQAEAGLVNTQDATLGHAFDARQIDNLPFEGRDPAAILSLQPGVAFVGNNGTINPDADSRNGAVNGGRSDQTNITIDGIDDNDQTKGYAFQGALRATLDSIQEFRVTTRAMQMPMRAVLRVRKSLLLPRVAQTSSMDRCMSTIARPLPPQTIGSTSSLSSFLACRTGLGS